MQAHRLEELARLVDDLRQGEKHLNLNSLQFSDIVDTAHVPTLLTKLAGARIDSVPSTAETRRMSSRLADTIRQ